MANEYEKEIPKVMAQDLRANLPAKISQSKIDEIFKSALEEYKDVSHI
ncbi:hypothetical protein ACFLZ6_02515 [Nanoarchaeota archaeon]